MRKPLVFALFVTCLLALPASADEAAVKKMINDYARAFNAKDINTVMSYWTEGGVHVDRESGERTEGRDAVKADIEESFKLRPGNRISGSIQRVHLVRPDVANVDGEVTVTSPDGDPSRSMFTAILVESDGKWKIDTIEETAAVAPESQYDALQELEWLIGRWVDDSENARVDTVFRWTSNRAFLLRSFAVTTADGTVTNGTQVIGWDPRAQEIRSWSFQSDGSFGDGTWSKSGDDWIVRSSQTLSDGQAASGTFVYSPLDDDAISIRLIGHEIEGEPQPSGGSVTVTRVAEPAVADSSATNE